MTQKPTPEGVNHFVGEVHKAHTPDDVLERRKWQKEMADDALVYLKKLIRDNNVVTTMDIYDFIRNWKPRGE